MSCLLYCTLGILLGGYGRIVFSKATAYDQRQTGDVNVQIHLKDVQVIALVDTDLVDDYTDYDYAYDYADFTLKPIVKPTTTSTTAPSPSTTKTSITSTSTSNVSTSSIKPWTIWPTKEPSTTDNSSKNQTVDTSKWNSTQAQSSTIPINEQESTIVTTTEPGSTIQSGNDDSAEGKNETSVKLLVNVKMDDRVILDDDLENIDENKNTTTTTVSSLKNSNACTFPYVADKKGHCRNVNKRRRVSLVPLTMRLGSRLTKKGHLSLRKDLPIRIFRYDTSQ